MSSLQRRDFLVRSMAFGAAAGAMGLAGRANAGDPSFMNNVPDPLLAGKELPTFKFALEKSEAKVIGGSSAREATAIQLPISKGIAGVSMRLGRVDNAGVNRVSAGLPRRTGHGASPRDLGRRLEPDQGSPPRPPGADRVARPGQPPVP
jgi:hypothetical protein